MCRAILCACLAGCVSSVLLGQLQRPEQAPLRRCIAGEGSWHTDKYHEWRVRRITQVVWRMLLYVLLSACVAAPNDHVAWLCTYIHMPGV